MMKLNCDKQIVQNTMHTARRESWTHKMCKDWLLLQDKVERQGRALQSLVDNLHQLEIIQEEKTKAGKPSDVLSVTTEWLSRLSLIVPMR